MCGIVLLRLMQVRREKSIMLADSFCLLSCPVSYLWHVLLCPVIFINVSHLNEHTCHACQYAMSILPRLYYYQMPFKFPFWDLILPSLCTNAMRRWRCEGILQRNNSNHCKSCRGHSRHFRCLRGTSLHMRHLNSTHFVYSFLIPILPASVSVLDVVILIQLSIVLLLLSNLICWDF